MSANKEDYSVLNLIGNVSVPRNVLPTLRASIRRTDPDGFSSSPYYPNLAGKVLSITYSVGNSIVVTNANITLPSNSLTSIISTISAVDSANLEALDEGGFLSIRNKNPGRTHFIRINPWTTPANDAAPIFGFRVLPFTGSTSFAGEVSSTPGTLTQNNPQGTYLIGQDEDLNSGTINRPLTAILDLIQDISNELDKDVIIYREIPVTFSLHPISNTTPSVEIQDASIRLPIEQLGLSGGPFLTGALDSFFTIISDDGLNKELVRSSDIDDELYDKAHILNAYYATSATAFSTLAFSTWGTPDGRSIYGSSIPNKTKHAAVTITSFDGSVAFCSSANFESADVMAGDLVQITSPVSILPFDHSGWFAVREVVSNTHLALRPLASSERIPSAGNRPRSINPAGKGSLRVVMGYFIPATQIYLTANVTGTPTAKLRVAMGVPLRQALTDDLSLDRTASFSALSDLLLQLKNIVDTDIDNLDDHINGLGIKHAAEQIEGFSTTNTFFDGSNLGGSPLPGVIENFILALRNTSAAVSGAHKIGSASMGIVSPPYTLSAGSIWSQLSTIVSELQGHINQPTAHTAASISYAGGGVWADGTTNPATTVEAQLDKIINDLTTSSGTARIQGGSVGSDLTSATLAAQLADIAVNWLKMSRANTIPATQTFSSVILANNGVTAGTNTNVSISGTGRYCHGDIPKVINASCFKRVETAGTIGVAFYGAHWEYTNTLGPKTIYASVDLPVGARIRSIQWWFDKVGSATSLDLDLEKQAPADASPTNLATYSDTTSGTGVVSITMSSINYEIESGYEVRLKVFYGGTATVKFLMAELTYDYPV